jgi:ribonucleoside-diphosphate reductase alpha chain
MTIVNDTNNQIDSSAARRLQIRRHFTFHGEDPLARVTYAHRSSKISNSDGSTVFELKDVLVPEGWSQLATDIIVSKYFRKGGVPGTGHETSVRQVVYRVAHTIRAHGEQNGYFADAVEAEAFEAELSHMLIHQYGAFNSPVWFNVGLFHEYGVVNVGETFRYDPVKGAVSTVANSYEYPQSSACFIQAVDDDLMSIFELVQNEARVFKYGSGTGTCFDKIRGKQEKLSGGGTSSGLMSWLKVLDAGAGSIKSGGTCLAPYQRVYTATGPVAVEELAQRESFVAMSYDPPAGRYKAKRAHAWQAGVKNVVRVITDKGTFDVTDDHPVKLSTGEYVHAGKLRAGHSLFACAIDMQHGHLRVHLRDGRKGKEFLHRLVASDVMGLDIEGLSVHHKDGNRHNNEPSNLETMAQAEHAREHSLDRVAEGTHIFQTERFPKSGDANGMHAASPFWQDEQKVAAYREVQGDILAKTGRAPIMQEYAAEQKMLNRAFKVLNAGYAIDTFDQYVMALPHVIGRVDSKEGLRRRIVNRFGSYENFVKAVAANNHRVVSVEPVGTLPVYDVEVECPTADDKSPSTGHNFVLWASDDLTGSGVVVANTRRAATMRVLSMDHPEIVEFIQWKSHEEKKARALIAQGYPSDFNGEAYQTVSGQNSNNSVRVTEEFMRAVVEDRAWNLTARTTGEVVKTYKARELWDLIAQAAWECADPGVQYDTTINAWHTVPQAGRIHASNPCSEFLHHDGTACNLASLNLTKFLRDDGSFDIEEYRHAVRIFFIAQEILVGLSAYPTATIAENSYKYRPLGLGYANLGTLLMTLGMPYDSDEARDYAACLTAIMHCHAGRVSAELASRLGPFEGYAANREPMLAVMRKHRREVHAIPAGRVPEVLRAAAYTDARELVEYGEQYGYRNSQFTLLAPTGTIGFLMDCDTTGIEPDFALVKHKKLAGGGAFKITNASVSKALTRLGYSIRQIQDIVTYVQGTQRFEGVLPARLLESRGLLASEISEAQARLRGAFTLDMAFGSKDVLARLGLPPGASVLRHLGFSPDFIDTATKEILGHGTLEGAPGMLSEHLPVFACANRCGDGTQSIAPIAHLQMMAAVQPFLSGAISKTCNVPNEATVEDIKELYFQGWKLGLKAVAIYRDGCKSSQPLTSTTPTAAAAAPPPSLEDLDLPEAQKLVATLQQRHGADVFAKVTMPTQRQRLPKNRAGTTQEATIGGTKLFLRTGEYPDGRVGEIFIDMHKEGAAFRAMANSFAIAVSLGLQYGVPLEEYVDQFTFVRFEPHGPVQDDAHVKHATSVLDYVFRHLGVNYLNRDDLAHIKPITPMRFGGRALVLPGEIVKPVTVSMLLPAAGDATQSATESESESEYMLSPELAVSKKSGAPFCDSCGHQTVRNATCWRCLNCGTSMGCS